MKLTCEDGHEAAQPGTPAAIGAGGHALIFPF